MASRPFIPPGEVLGYTIHFENIGTIEAWDVFLTDVLDADLPAGETDGVFFVVQAPEDLLTGTEIRNEATIQFEVFETLTTNETLNIRDDGRPVLRSAARVSERGKLIAAGNVPEPDQILDFMKKAAI